MVDQNIQDGFTKIHSDKEKIATAITNKGIKTNSSDTLETMAENINKIEQTGGGSSDLYLDSIGASEIIINSPTALISYFYYIRANSSSDVDYNTGPFTISNIFLKNVKDMGAYCFYCNKKNYFTIESLSCPKLETIKQGSFYNVALPNLNQNSFPKLSKINQNCFYYANFGNISLKDIFPNVTFIDRAFAYANITNGEIIFPNLITLNLSSTGYFFNGGTIKKIILPKLREGIDVKSAVFDEKPVYVDRLLKRVSNLIELNLWSIDYSNYDFWSNIGNNTFPVLEKLILGELSYYSSSYTGDHTVSNTSVGAGCPTLKYLHVGNSFPENSSDSSVQSELFTNFSGLEYLIIGYAGGNNFEEWLRLPKVTGCGNIKAIVLTGTLSGTQNRDLRDDLNNEEKIANLKEGLLDTEDKKGYLYLADADYNAFMATTATANSNKEWLQGRTRKWSEYKDLLLNTYGLDSITDWYN